MTQCDELRRALSGLERQVLAKEESDEPEVAARDSRASGVADGGGGEESDAVLHVSCDRKRALVSVRFP